MRGSCTSCPSRRSPERLKALGVGGGSEFWGVVRGNLSVLDDAPSWWQVVAGEVSPLSEDTELTQRAAALLPPEPWDDTTWDVWIAAIKAATGRKGRALFHPAAPRTHRPRGRPRAQSAAAAHRARQGRGAAARPHVLIAQKSRQCAACRPTKLALRMKATGISWPKGSAQAPSRTSR